MLQPVTMTTTKRMTLFIFAIWCLNEIKANDLDWRLRSSIACFKMCSLMLHANFCSELYHWQLYMAIRIGTDKYPAGTSKIHVVCSALVRLISLLRSPQSSYYRNMIMLRITKNTISWLYKTMPLNSTLILLYTFTVIERMSASVRYFHIFCSV